MYYGPPPLSTVVYIYISCQMNKGREKHSNFHHGIRATLNPSLHTQPPPPTKGIFLLCTQPLKVSSLSIDYIPLHHLAHHTSHISNLQLLFWCLFLSAFPLFVWLVSWEWWPCVNLCSGSVLHLYWLVFCISFPPRHFRSSPAPPSVAHPPATRGSLPYLPLSLFHLKTASPKTPWQRTHPTQQTPPLLLLPDNLPNLIPLILLLQYPTSIPSSKSP